MFGSPLYTAVMLCTPAVAKLMLKLTTPAFRLPVTNVVAPSLMFTVPVGLLPLTVTVKLTF